MTAYNGRKELSDEQVEEMLRPPKLNTSGAISHEKAAKMHHEFRSTMEEADKLLTNMLAREKNKGR